MSDALLLALQHQGSGGRAKGDVEEILKIVNQVPMLQQLAPSVRWKLCEQVRGQLFRPGELICREDERADKFYFILSGAVQVRLRERVASGADIASLRRAASRHPVRA